MHFSIALIAGAATAAAQVALPSSIFGLPFGQQCQAAVLQAVTNGSFAQCFPTAALLPLLSSNGSIIPVLDNFMSQLCYSQPCSDAALMSAAQTISTGCASDIKMGGLPNNTVEAAFSIYPTLREVLCTKTKNPYTAQSYGGFLGPAPIPVTAYNSTNGTFCVSSFLTQYSAYLGANLTLPYIVAASTGANQTAQNLILETRPNILCNECIFAGVDIIEAKYPVLGNITLGMASSYINQAINGSIPQNVQSSNATLNSYMNSTCAYENLAVNTTTLPMNITVSIVNSTFTPKLMMM